jgi:hypothetical protein
MFNVTDKMNLNLVVASRWWFPFSQIMESVVLVDLIDFNVHGLLPFLVAIFSIDGWIIFPILWDKDTKLACGAMTGLMELGLLDHASKLDFSISNAFERLPARCVEEVIVLGMQSTTSRSAVAMTERGSKVSEPSSQ